MMKTSAEHCAFPTYLYLGDGWTAAEWKGARCEAVRRADGKCIRGRNGSMLVRFLDSGQERIVVARRLRKQVEAPQGG